MVVPMLEIKVSGLEQMRKEFADFSDRRFAAAVATALTRTGRNLVEQWRSELQSSVDRPTSLTTRAPIATMATARSLASRVSLRDQVMAGTPPSDYLKPLEFGGGRTHKKFERALIAQGSMPASSYAIPTDNADRDGYGNVRRQLLVQILVQLAGGSVSGGYRRVISASQAKRAQAAIKAGKQFVAVLQQTGKLYPGIYARANADGTLRMVFSYERRTYYKRQLSLIDRAARSGQGLMETNMRVAFNESAARLRARNAR
jgi:hypothetical protein